MWAWVVNGFTSLRRWWKQQRLDHFGSGAPDHVTFELIQFHQRPPVPEALPLRQQVEVQTRRMRGQLRPHPPLRRVQGPRHRVRRRPAVYLGCREPPLDPRQPRVTEPLHEPGRVRYPEHAPHRPPCHPGCGRPRPRRRLARTTAFRDLPLSGTTAST
ncbi:hypothetical protein SNE510_06610 [Streptomyces sp. NE5-10]|uniref:hypothetical protein n=1 Tax=Streptomyces sp. NE5-10 TaxID=2759674 RepID=UPI0019088C3B|nr:hypothetical protein [Streptomyces sp. NE5-10]GHJ91142.1 hypothetical protein SNE510_06610 [Streptomyces sp. NE5-10]